jgi:hypothetical protein
MRPFVHKKDARMKLIIMAAALMLGGAAVAQTTEEETTTTTTAMPAGGQTVAPDNSAPERDARGIAVISDPATAPSGYNQGAQTVPAGTPPPTVAAPTPNRLGSAAALHPYGHRPLYPDLRARPGTPLEAIVPGSSDLP